MGGLTHHLCLGGLGLTPGFDTRRVSIVEGGGGALSRCLCLFLYGVAWRCMASRGVAWCFRGVTWRGVASLGVMRRRMASHGLT